MLPFGKLADRKGFKNIYLIGFAIFLISSLLCGLSSGLTELVTFRAVQGIGGAMIFTVIMTFIPIYLPPNMRVSAIGFTTLTAAAGVGLGPPIGGFITTLIGWRWIFFVNIPVCLASVWAIWKFIPTEYPKSVDAKFDYTGSFFFMVSIIAFLFAINMGREFGWTSPTILGSCTASVIFTAAFFFRERHIDYPILDLHFFQNRSFNFALLALIVSLMTFGGVLFLFPFLLIDYMQLTPHAAGMIMMLLAVGQLVSPWTGLLTSRFGIVQICIIGLALGCIPSIIFLFLNDTTSIFIIMISLGLFSFTQGISKAPNISLLMESVPLDKKSAVSSIVTLCRSLSIALGVLFFETIFSDSIPHGISLSNQRLSDGISHVRELHSGFFNAFLFCLFLSILSVIFMSMLRRKKV
jgi:EmrB/QacA subfamily drug resistance transporter